MQTNGSFWSEIADQGQNTVEILQLVFLLLFPGIALSLFIAVICSLAYLIRPTVKSGGAFGVFGITMVLGFVAFVVGFVSANSRETVVGDVIPVLMGGFGALLVYSYIKGQVQTFAAGATAVAFSASLFTGLVTGGQNRDEPGTQGVSTTSFLNVSQAADQASLHRSDVVAYNAVLETIEQLRSDEEVSKNEYAGIDLVMSFVLPRRNYHLLRAFTSDEMERYQALRRENPDLDLTTIERDFDGDDRNILREIHFALNPLENYNP